MPRAIAAALPDGFNTMHMALSAAVMSIFKPCTCCERKHVQIKGLECGQASRIASLCLQDHRQGTPLSARSQASLSWLRANAEAATPGGLPPRTPRGPGSMTPRRSLDAPRGALPVVDLTRV